MRRSHRYKATVNRKASTILIWKIWPTGVGKIIVLNGTSPLPDKIILAV